MDEEDWKYIEEDENKQLEEFYMENLMSLENITIGDIHHHYLNEIPAIVHSTSLNKESDWKTFANDLEISNNRVMRIEAEAYARKLVPMYIVLAEELSQKSYAHLIRTLLKRKNYNILRVLKDYTRNLLENNCVTETGVDHRTLEKRPYEAEKLIQNSSVQNGRNFFEEGSSHRGKIFPSAPRLSVLIQHTESDTDVAKELSSILREAGFNAKAMFQMDVVKAMNPNKALVTVFQEVDFVVPIVSDKLLQQLKGEFPESSNDAKDNKTLYDYIMNEYRNNDCLNLRTRPVIMPQMDRQHLMEDARWTILAFSFRLWKEVPKLITVMRETNEYASSLKALKGSKKKYVKGMQ